MKIAETLKIIPSNELTMRNNPIDMNGFCIVMWQRCTDKKPDDYEILFGKRFPIFYIQLERDFSHSIPIRLARLGTWQSEFSPFAEANKQTIAAERISVSSSTAQLLYGLFCALVRVIATFCLEFRVLNVVENLPIGKILTKLHITKEKPIPVHTLTVLP